jgi:hypothetical protein
MRRDSSGSRLARTLMSVVCLVAGCRPVDAPEQPAAPRSAEASRPGVAGVRSAWARVGPREWPQQVKYEAVNGLALFEGDIVLGTVEDVERESESVRAQAEGRVSAQSIQVTGSSKRWPGGEVPYVHVYGSLDDNLVVGDAIRHWQRRTGLRFVPVSVTTPTSTPHIYFIKGEGCSSRVGRQGGRQFVTLAGDCGLGATIHELGHAIGFWHEQSRADRDSYVQILWDNIEPGHEHNFEKHVDDGTDFGPYDYDSIMHYRADEFGKQITNNVFRTTIQVPGGQTIGQRDGLSAGDVASAASMYPGVMKGSVEEISATGQVKGWALDTASPSESVAVHYYIDGVPGSSPGMAVPTSLYRADINSANDGIVGNHGFSFAIPAAFRDNQPHTLRVYGIDAQGISNPLLAGTPITFTLPGAMGALDSYSLPGTVTGWALDMDSPTQSLQVYYTVDGIPASATTLQANLYRADVKTMYPASSGAHGFAFNLPEGYNDGQPHTLRIFAVDAQGIHNPELPGSPKTFTIPLPVVQHAGNFAGPGNVDQMLALSSWGLSVADYTAGTSWITLAYEQAWTGPGYLMSGWHDVNDVKLTGDFLGLGYDQLLLINTSGSGGRVFISDLRDGVAPVELRYLEFYGHSAVLNGWHDPEDLQLVGDFLNRGYDQVMFINRTGGGGRVMITDFHDGNAPVEGGYLELWGTASPLEGWLDPDALLFAGDFQNLGYAQLLCINRSGTAGRAQVLDFHTGVAPAQVRYFEAAGGATELDDMLDDGDAQAVGDFRGYGYDQLLLVNGGSTGDRVRVLDFQDGAAPAEVRFRSLQGQVGGYLPSKVWIGDFRGLGYDQVLYGVQGNPFSNTFIVDLQDGVVPMEVRFHLVEIG